MDSVPVTANLTMLRVNGWQLYVWREGDSATLIDTGAPGSGTEIAAAVPGLDRIVSTPAGPSPSTTAIRRRNQKTLPRR